MRTAVVKHLPAILGVVLLGLAVWVLHHELAGCSYHDLTAFLRKLSAGRLFWAVVFACLSYLSLTGYDLMALRHVDRPLGLGRTMLTSFVSYVFANNVGMSGLGGTAVRLRLYSAWGLSALEILQVTVFCSLTFVLGLTGLSGVVLASRSTPAAGTHVPGGSVRALGVAFLVALTVYLIWTFRGTRRLRVRQFELRLPALPVSLGQILVGAADLVFVAAVLYVLLTQSAHIGFMTFLACYLLALLAGLVSSLPGGVGVFEAVIILNLPRGVGRADAMGALVVYRFIYYLLPLMVATTILAWHELRFRNRQLERMAKVAGRIMRTAAPHVFAFAALFAGAVLLFSAATPGLQYRLTWLARLVPLPVIELSHFLGSLCGICLLLVARGIQRRLDGAYLAGVTLLAAGVAASLFKGGEYEVAAILAILFIAFVPCRKLFYRKSSLFAEPLSVEWLVAVAAVLVSTVWLGLFLHRHVEYSAELWWQFSLHGHASRFLRAVAGACALALFWGLAWLLRPASARGNVPVSSDPREVEAIVQQTSPSSANLAFLGDKQLLVNDHANAFIMYGTHGRSWIAMGDPVGPIDEWPDLMWSFRELVDRHAGLCAFYQVSPANLSLYIDLGLTLRKLGEEAHVDLAGFSLEGGSGKGFRRTIRKVEAEGYAFSVLPASGVPEVLGELRAVSDQWLATKRAQEKGFSLGRFDEAYLRRFPVAVVRRAGGDIAAFANIWQTRRADEFSIDLMRYADDAPDNVMEYLLTQLALWGKEQGIGTFNLGMAPLSGLPDHELADFWSRAGSALFSHGAPFYNFQGLRAYKEKFHPIWVPKYLAYPGVFAFPRILTDIVALIGGGLRGAIRR